jgi:hypothetical protein
LLHLFIFNDFGSLVLALNLGTFSPDQTYALSVHSRLVNLVNTARDIIGGLDDKIIQKYLFG